MADYPTLRQTFFPVVNNLNSTLSADVPAVDSEYIYIQTADAAAFPDEGLVSVGNEIIWYTSKTGNRLNVAMDGPTVIGRGYDDTTAAAHSVGAAVSRRVVKYDVESVRDVLDDLQTLVGFYEEFTLATNTATPTNVGTIFRIDVSEYRMMEIEYTIEKIFDADEVTESRRLQKGLLTAIVFDDDNASGVEIWNDTKEVDDTGNQNTPGVTFTVPIVSGEAILRYVSVSDGPNPPDIFKFKGRVKYYTRATL
jgi:hypothetical protein